MTGIVYGNTVRRTFRFGTTAVTRLYVGDIQVFPNRINWPVEAGSFALAGGDVEFARDKRLVAETGTFALSGNGANLVVSRRIHAQTGEFALSGNDADIAKGRFFRAETGDFALSGNDAALTQNRILRAEPGQFDLTGNDAGMSVGVLPTGYSFTMVAGDYFSLYSGYLSSAGSGGGPPVGSIDAEPIPGHPLYQFLVINGQYFGSFGFGGDALAALAGKSVWVSGIEYPFDDIDWTYDGDLDATLGVWGTGTPALVPGLTYFCEVK